MRRSLALLWFVTASGAATAQQPAGLPDRGDALVAASGTFAFYSDPVFNLHDFLVWNTFSREPPEPAAECLASLPSEQRAAFERALEHYKVLAGPAGNDLLRTLRYRLAGFRDVRSADAPAVEVALAVLPPAAPVYEKCWWPAHDARNRRWIAALQPMLDAHEDALTKRLTELYGEDLGRRPFPVDIVSYATDAGANSVVNPDHLLLSSVAPGNAGYAGLEVVFHEASHTVFGPGLEGRLWTEIEAAVAADGAPLPRDFWHTMLFFTTGGAVEARLAAAGIDYRQTLYTGDWLGWSAFRTALEQVWQPYVDGRVPMADAVQQIVAAPKLPDRGTALVVARGTFAFYSDLATNLHDFLVWNARSPQPLEPKPECLATLTAEQRSSFEHARDYYAKTFADGAGESIVLSLRWHFAKLGAPDFAEPGQVAATLAELSPATAAYEACWWHEHDARNRRWIASLLPLLEANDDALRARLAALYGRQLSRYLPVDVVGYASSEGTATVLNPHQIVVSSAAPANQGNSALDVVFGQAASTLFSMRVPGPLWQALQQTSRTAATPLPDDLLRLLRLYTTGKAVEARLAAQGVRDYVPYVYAAGLMERATSVQRVLLEQTWQPYVDGRVPMADAAQQLVDALPVAPPP